MPEHLRLTLICNDPVLATAAIAGGVDRVLVDLERRGKAERQRGRGLFLSAHQWADVEALRKAVPRGALVVRLDPLHEETGDQVACALSLGADVLMLPYFYQAESVLRFAELVGGRAVVLPLVETWAAVQALASILAAGAIAEFHIGLNDLALDMQRSSLQDLWGDPVLDGVAAVARTHGVPFGIGGVADPRLNGLPVDPAWVIGEQKRLGSTGALLGRSFRSEHESAPDTATIRAAVVAIRDAYQKAAVAKISELEARAAGSRI